MQRRGLKYPPVIAVLVFLVILFQNPPWFFWKYGMPLSFAAVLASLGIMAFYRHPRRTLQTKHVGALLLATLVFVFIPILDSLRMSSVISLAAFLVAVMMTQDEKRKVFDILTQVLFWIILISLPAWLFSRYVTPLPLFGSLDLSTMKGAEYMMNNYFFFVGYSAYPFFRFYSVFDEPGVLGTLLAFVFYGTGYNFLKLKNLVLLIGGFFTFSLAFYILLGVGFVMTPMVRFKTKIISGITTIILVIGIFTFSADDIFEMLVVNRLENLNKETLDEKRSNASLDAFFSQYIRSSDFILGKGTNFLDNKQLAKGQTYKYFVTEYGLLGIISLLLLYICMTPFNYRSYVLLLLFTLSFLQRPFAFRAWQILLYAVIIAVINARENGHGLSVKRGAENATGPPDRKPDRCEDWSCG